MKKYIALALAFALFALTACAAGVAPSPSPAPSQSPSPAPSQSPSATPDPAMIKPETPERIEENNIPDSGYVFELTAEEQALYDSFKVSKDMNVFKDADPVSIAKVHLMYGVKGEWESEYKMFYAADGLSLTLEDYKKLYEADRAYEIEESKQSLANWFFPLMEQGEFVEEGSEGVIHFNTVPEDPDDPEEDTAARFWMVKDSAGLWWVRENPLYWGSEE